MSPFFRGSVRPAKKHPRAWSLNPRLNPDLGKEGLSSNAAPRMSILGLPSQPTDVVLPVFNGVYTTDKSSRRATTGGLEAIRERAGAAGADAGRRSSADSGRPQHAGAEYEEDVTSSTAWGAAHDSSGPQGKAAGISAPAAAATIAAGETVGVAERDRAHATAAAAGDRAAETAAAAAAADSTRETVLEAAPAPAPPAASDPTSPSSWPLPAEPVVVSNPATGAAADEMATMPGQQAGTNGAPHQTRVGGTPAGTEGQAASEIGTTEAPVGPAAEGGFVPVRSSPAEVLTTISEEPRAGEAPQEEAAAAKPLPAPVEDPSLPSISEQPADEELQAADDDEATPPAHGGVEAAPAAAAVAEEEDEDNAGAIAAKAARSPADQDGEVVTADDDESAAEAPIIPRHPSSEYTTLPAGQDPYPGAQPRGGGGHRYGASIASTSADGSVANEPLMTDEQLDVSDEFRPDVRMYAMESSR